MEHIFHNFEDQKIANLFNIKQVSFRVTLVIFVLLFFFQPGSIAAASSVTYMCPTPTPGQYISLQKIGPHIMSAPLNDMLQFCELEAYGIEKKNNNYVI